MAILIAAGLVISYRSYREQVELNRIVACAHLNGHPNYTIYLLQGELDEMTRKNVERQIALRILTSDIGCENAMD